jgi:tetratricopeptide (TPR) repeat protein
VDVVARLRIVSGDGTEQVVDLTGTRLQIGRGRDNNIVLPDSQKGVSRVHAELRYENGHYIVVDLQSQNGTWINGRRIERSELPYGAELSIGAYRLTLLSDRTAPERPAAARQPDPLDDIRPTERYDPPMVAPVKPQPAHTGGSRWAMAAALGFVLVVALVAVVWMSSTRGATATSDAGALESPAPAAANGASPAPPPPSPAPGARTAEPGYQADVPARKAADRSTDSSRPSDAPRITRRPGESNDAWRNRAAALQMRYGYSKAALDRGDFAAAAGGFEAILLEEPGFLDAPRLLVQAQAGMRASARSLYEEGKRLDEAGDWVGALQKYEQARQIQAGIPGLSDSLQRVRSRLRVAGTTAFNQGRALETNGRAEEALKEYQKAVQWLPADDPNLQIARARVEQLKRKQ